MHAISSLTTQALHGVEATRRREQQAAMALPAHTLMQRAGLAAARLSLALAPHARRIWVACGPGNNGGDGLEAAMHLHQRGKEVLVTWQGPGDDAGLPPDARASLERARKAGLAFAATPPPDFDFAIDALFGIGGKAHAPTGPLAQWLTLLRTTEQPVLAIDVPSGLNADTGALSFAPESIAAKPCEQRAGARFTLSLLTLKPGLFTGAGRDMAGQVWLDDLGVDAISAPDAWLLGQDRAGRTSRSLHAHTSHKGSFGDVAIVGGESGPHTHMAGAALLAARAALHMGAGRVFVALLGEADLSVDPQQPELMFRNPDALDLKSQVVVCGCGGGASIAAMLPRILSSATALVLDADALNAVAADPQLQTQLKARQGRGYRTVLTPHPLEAARLLGTPTAQVQGDRLEAARRLSATFGCVVVLKGSGTVIAAPGEVPVINSSGNARLATAGTGDVLAGMLGAWMADGAEAFAAACGAVFIHGKLADQWDDPTTEHPLTASLLAKNHQADLQQKQKYQRG